MKKLSLLIALFIMGGVKMASAQATAENLPYDTTLKKIIYTEVVQVPGASKDLLYDRAYKNLSIMFKYGETKMSVKDKANGKIVFNGFVKVLFKEKNGMTTQDPDLVKYKLTMLFKDGKYKYEITDFIVDRAGVPFHIERWREHNKPGDKTFSKDDRIQEKLDFVAQDIEKVLNRLKPSMTADKVEEKKDW